MDSKSRSEAESHHVVGVVGKVDGFAIGTNFDTRIRCNSLGFRSGYKPHTTEEYAELTEKIRDEMAERSIVP